MGLYLKVIHNLLLKRIDGAEFSVDEFGVIWFIFAKNIVIAEENKLNLD